MNKKKIALATLVSLTTAFNTVPLQVFAETNVVEPAAEMTEDNKVETPVATPENSKSS